jgi:hypothetical protein
MKGKIRNMDGQLDTATEEKLRKLDRYTRENQIYFIRRTIFPPKKIIYYGPEKLVFKVTNKKEEERLL